MAVEPLSRDERAAFGQEPPPDPTSNEPRLPWEGTVLTVPKDWATMFGVDKTLNPHFEKNNFTEFVAYTTPSISYLKTYVTGGEPYNFHASKKIGGYRIFLPDTPLMESFTHTYAAGTSTYDAAMNKLKETAASIMRAPVSAVTGSTMGIIYDSPQVYESTGRRNFSVDIQLIANSDLDKDVYDVIKFFRLNSFPKKVGHRTGLIEFPSVFKISGGVWDSFQSRENYYVLKAMEVTFGDKVKFMKYGYPMQATLKLTFEECVIMTQEQFNKNPVSFIIGGETISSEEAAIPKVVQRILKKTKPFDYTTALAHDGDYNVDGVEGEIQKILHPSWGPNGAAGGYVPGGWISPKPSPKRAEGTAGPEQGGAMGTIKKFILTTLVAGAVKNIQTIIINQVKSKVLELIMTNKYMKKFQGVADVDPRHRVEIKAKMKNIKYAKWVV